MVKGLGLVFIVLCFSFAGFGLTNRLTRRVKRLEQGLAAMRQIRLTLSSSKAPSLRVLQMAEHRTGGDFPLIRKCLELSEKGVPFPEAWQTAARGLPDLPAEDKALFEQAGEILGRDGIRQQEEALLQWEEQIYLQIGAAKEKLKSHARLYNGLGVLTGLLVAVLLA